MILNHVLNVKKEKGINGIGVRLVIVRDTQNVRNVELN